VKQSKIHLEWAGSPARQFRTGVSLHSHTLHSQEPLGFLCGLGKRSKPIRLAIERLEARLTTTHRTPIHLERVWWTPPAGPREAWQLERNQIEQRFGLQSLVSLTDHDDINAPMNLRVLEQCRNVPISLEWSVPYGPTFFHIGLHNLPAQHARSLFAELARLTAAREIPTANHTKATSTDITPILETLARDPAVLIVFNHPAWDESHIGEHRHLELVTQFLHTYGASIHALELNGLRPWNENRVVCRLADSIGKPVISGGDRHALEPNTILDLTDASQFPEFVEQVRSGFSDVLLTSQYREPFPLRILQSIKEVFRDYDHHACGWRRWSDRAFYRGDDAVVRPLTALLPERMLATLRPVVQSLIFLQPRAISKALRTLRSVLPQPKFAR
jgi:hypothetical protein